MFDVTTPDRIYAELFNAVQVSDVFGDSKTFVDATPKSNPARILKLFRKQYQESGFDLRSFVELNFELPALKEGDFTSNTQRSARQHIDLLWNVLTRDPDAADQYSSLVALPHPYVVPGGRFREIYYWDSYFTMLGLAASGRNDLVENMVLNFAFLIDRIGFIPNGNRSYFCTRSQPPFFVLMVELLVEVKQDKSIYKRFLPQLEKEYTFWMSGSDTLDDDRIATRRVIAVDRGYLNRYWDDSDLPRQESYAEDLAIAAATDREAADVYRDIRAACESGWDFSSRWLEDNQVMGSIRTSQIVPVDLNAIMYKLESVLAQGYRLAGKADRATFFQNRSEHRKDLIQSLFFCEQDGFFVDLVLPDMNASSTHTLAAAFPLFFNLATPEQATAVARKIDSEFLRPGGWVTTLTNNGQQWDAPNGWAPLQWIVYNGLNQYNFGEQAKEGARRWVENNLSVYRNSGKLVEKYNVETIGLFAEGGEYAVQDGFGWTNGVLLGLLNELGMD